MSEITVENILSQVNQLPAAEREKLIAELTKEAKSKPEFPRSKVISTQAPFIDRSLEDEWLAQHQREYIGQWVALSGNKLVASGPIAKEVYAKTRELGIKSPFVLYVEDPEIPFVNI